ncbi:MAG: hypothetical protein RMJ48_19035 [Roseiflexaceae bacterium]|nr:hypothetical protein [Roseiflexaceae bacterium]
MTETTLVDLQASVRDTSAFNRLEDYYHLYKAFLELMQKMRPTRIISPTHTNYVFYQYDATYSYKITRPLNTSLFIESENEFDPAFQRFVSFLADLKQYRDTILDRENAKRYVKTLEINRVVYTVQQSIGSIGDSFQNPNQSRRRVGQLFEILVKLIIQEVGLECEPRTISIPIPDYPGYEMSYELDLVFSRNKAIVAAETRFIHETEIVGSVKTTSKDRIDKIFLDKYLLTRLLGRDVPVIAIFLHDVQRAKAGNSIFGINSTFKSNHFLGYTVALNRLDGVYYVDPRPEMLTNDRLREQIRDFQTFLVKDLWELSVR